VARDTFEDFLDELEAFYSEYTPEFAEKESGVKAETIIDVARQIGRAGTRFSCHNWRSAGAGNLGGWAVARCLHFLSVLTGSVGTEGGTLPSAWNKFKPAPFSTPPAQKFWNELHYPLEYPLSHYEMSFLLPHLLKDKRGQLAVYFTRVFNPYGPTPTGSLGSKLFRMKPRSVFTLHSRQPGMRPRISPIMSFRWVTQVSGMT
jgi:anaerobic selenocysteine-containing dehydrogenase